MRVTTTYKANGKGTGQIVAKGNGRQRTAPYDHSLSVAANHGQAARSFVSKVAPGYRRNEILNSVKVVEAKPGKTVFIYKD
jgi:hypothetical protein